MKTVIKSVNDLKVYQMAYQLAMEIFEITKKFPKEETYSLTDQMRRSLRSVAIIIREGYAKRKYKQVFIRHLNDVVAEAEFLDKGANVEIIEIHGNRVVVKAVENQS